MADGVTIDRQRAPIRPGIGAGRLSLVLLALGAAGVTLLAGPDPAVAGPARTRPAIREVATADHVARCSISQLVVWLDTEVNHAANGALYELELTNLSNRRCTLAGFPTVSAVGLSGRPLGPAASRSGPGAPVPVTIGHGDSAISTVQITNVGDLSRSSCHQVTAAGLRVHPPGLAASKVVPFAFPACAGTGARYLSVQTVRSF